MLSYMVAEILKNKNSYDMKIYFHSIKIILYLIKHIFIISPIFDDIKIYFYSSKTNLYSIKNIFIISPFFPWYQNIFSFSQNKFVFSKKYFYHIYLFHSSKINIYYMNFSLNTFLVSISSICIYKSQNLLSVCKLNSSTRMWILTLSWRRSLSYRNQSIDFSSKSKEWFLYDRDLRHERFKHRAFT